MFEAIHGSAPRRAGQNLANPSGLLLGSVLMLIHIGQNDVAERVHNAWLRTLEEGVHTYDIFSEGVSKQKVGTTSAARTVTVQNRTRSAVAITNIKLAGSGAQQFAYTSNCGSSVPGNGRCAIKVTFKPSSKGAKSATLSVNDGGNGLRVVDLTGTGT